VSDNLDDYLKLIANLSPEERIGVEAEALKVTKDQVWIPNPGPQSDAYFCEADELFYGGQAGGGKTDVVIGLACTAHKRSLILRRTNKEVQGLVERMSDILGSRDGWSSQTGIWRVPGARTVDMGGCQLEEDKQKYKGNPHDLIAWDEVSDFSESQYLFVNGWNRSADPAQRCRVVAAGNPPTRPEGLWIVKRFAAWLDPQHPRPAKPGELRWFTTIDGKDTEVDGPGPHIIQGEPLPVFARSRTFIPATLADNPDLAATDYRNVLSSLPEELRLAYRDGRFDVALQDDAYQAIPTAWILAAQARWTPQPPVGVPMCAIGQDIAQGGLDTTVLAPRYDGWYAPLIEVPGKETPDGNTAAALVFKYRRGNAKVIVDVGGGWGAECYGHLKANGIDCRAYMGVKATTRKTAVGGFDFVNTRSAAYWQFREALDPSQEGGSPIALPQNPMMVADLCAPHYEKTSRGIAIEPKDQVCKRLGRSTNGGDAVVMAWYDGLKQHNVQGGWKNHRHNRAPQVILRRE
jgi:hypothetical protein